MKRTFLALVAVAISFAFATNSFAITEKEHQQYLKEYPAYAQADRELNQAWKNLKSVASKEQYDELLKEQRAWNKQKDGLVRQAMAQGGMTYPQAAVAVMNRRTREIGDAILVCEGRAGSARPDDYDDGRGGAAQSPSGAAPHGVVETKTVFMVPLPKGARLAEWPSANFSFTYAELPAGVIMVIMDDRAARARYQIEIEPRSSAIVLTLTRGAEKKTLPLRRLAESQLVIEHLQVAWPEEGIFFLMNEGQGSNDDDMVFGLGDQKAGCNYTVGINIEGGPGTAHAVIVR